MAGLQHYDSGSYTGGNRFPDWITYYVSAMDMQTALKIAWKENNYHQGIQGRRPLSILITERPHNPGADNQFSLRFTFVED